MATTWQQVSSGLIVTVSKAELQALFTQYDSFFFYDGVPWHLESKHKGAGIYLCWRVRHE